MYQLNSLLDLKEKDLQSCLDELSTLPEGTIYLEKRKQGLFVFHAIKEGNHIRRKSISKNTDLIQKFCRKELLKKRISALKAQIKIIEEAIANSPSDETADLIKTINKRFLVFDQSYFYSSAELTDWSKQPYDKSAFHPEHLTQPASSNLMVRSKSEAIIARLLIQYKIDFHYEEILSIGNQTFVPDFTIRKQDGEIIYWEHCGMPFNADYWNKHNAKLKIYETVGIYPFKNLIITYDDEHNRINPMEIERKILTNILNK